MQLEASTLSRFHAQMRTIVVLLVLSAAPFALIGPTRVAHADALSTQDVPEPLRPWVSWVLRGQEEQRCPFFHGQAFMPDKSDRGGVRNRGCAWPARLKLELDDDGGRFSGTWRVHARSTVTLVGDAKHWPEDVMLDGQPAPVLRHNDRPTLQLESGVHVVSGRFRWARRPELLQVPPETGLVELSVSGLPVRFPNRDAQGRLWLRPRVETKPGAANRIEIVVNRHAIDDTPFLLETQIELQVSGEAREVLLGKALPSGFVPMSLQSPLPARLDPDGRLRAQVRPGRWILNLMARHEGPVQSLTVPTQPNLEAEARAEVEPIWDPDEVWAFESRPRLRAVEVSGGTPVDPTQTSLPPKWHRLPSYLLVDGTSLTLTEKRRGDSDPAPDVLNLHRRWWLDFDGGGFTVSDQISGVVRRSARLEMGERMLLGRASLNGRDQVITETTDSRLRGIEVPPGSINLAADSRADGRSDLTAATWAHDFQSLSGVLHLPPGWRLLHASGVDQAETTWINRWSLLDLFAVLIIAMATLRLFGAPWAALALAALTLCFPEPASPKWSFLAILAGIALVRARAEGRFGQAAVLFRGLAAATVVLIAIPFCVHEIRVGLHPALDVPRPSAPEFAQYSDDQAIGALDAATPLRTKAKRAAGLMDELAATEAPSSLSEILDAREAFEAERKNASNVLDKPDPNARVTTGPGLPTWYWNQVALTWSGPVGRDQPLSFSLLSPRANFFLAFLRVGLLAGFILRLLWAFREGSSGPDRQSAVAKSNPVTTLLALAIAGFALHAGAVRADMPSEDLLNELKERLLEQPDCFPRCASSPRLGLDIRPQALDLRLELHTVAATAVPLPGSAGSWVPARVLVDGRPAEALQRDRQGVLWIQLDPGRHQILLTGPLPDQDNIDLPLPMRPHRTTVRAEGWRVHGVHENGQTDASLQLTRIDAGSRKDKPTLGASRFPPFVRVTRNLQLGLDWQVETQVVRLTPADVAAVLEIPLLPGESVTTDGVRVEGGRAFITLAPGVTQRNWTSRLEVQSDLVLEAPESVAWTENWRLHASATWHVEASGIPPVHEASGRTARVRAWRPWPGERVTLSVTRPAGVEGSTLTIDSSSLRASPGLRSTEVELTLSIRSSRGGEHQLVLPEDAVVADVLVDGVSQPIQQQMREISLPIRPGSQSVVVRWRENHGISGQFVYRSPSVDLGLPSVNHQIEIAPSAGRWILLAGGPLLGPSVLFWPLLGTMTLLAFALGLYGRTPLRVWHWLLLFVGLTQAPIIAAAIPVLWLHALADRKSNGASRSKLSFNSLQIGLVLLTLSSLAVLFYSIQQGLLGAPAMQIAGNGSSSTLLRWYQDRVAATPSGGWVLSVPLLVYRLAMLSWALWIAQALIGWLRWGWACFSADELWRPVRETARTDQA